MRRMYSKKELAEAIKNEPKAISTIIDADGNERFIQGDGEPEEITGFTSSYCKWSLSGTHLMCVLAGTIAVNSVIGAGTTLASFSLPDWIKAKIVGVQYNLIEYKSIPVISDSYSVQNMSTYVDKGNVGIVFVTNAEFTASYGGGFRMTIDLMIE